MSAFYLPRGEQFEPTELTIGPWSDAHQHAGPPAALLGRAADRLPSAVPMQVARITVELLRAIPLEPLSVAARVVHDGKRTQTSELTLRAGDTELARATALRIRTADVVLPAHAAAPPPGFPAPEASPVLPFPFFRRATGYHTAVDLRFARGKFGDGDVVAWMRPLHPLVEGEAMTPLERVLVVADSGNGVSILLDPQRYTFVNPDLTVHLFRHPEGEWVALEARTLAAATGTGLAATTLHDARGRIGVSAQSLLVAPR